MITRLGGGMAMLLVGAVALSGAARADDPQPGPMEAAAQEISGSTDHRDPTELTAGLWSDELEPSDAGHYFDYSRVDENTTVHVAVFATSAPSDSITIETYAGDVSCGTATASSPYSNNGPAKVFGATVLIGRQGGSEDCANQREDLRIVVSRGSATGDLEPLPIRIKVVEEQRLADQQEHLDPERGSLPEPVDVDPPFVRPSGAPQTHTIRQGELQYFPLDLGWGQSLSAEAVTASMADQGIEGFSGPELSLDLIGPLGVPADDALADSNPADTLSEDEETTVTTGLGPVAYRNRLGSDLPYLPGRYWVAVGLAGAAPDAEVEQIEYELSLGVSGEVAGVPSYRGGEQPFLIGPGTWALDPSGAANASTEDDDAWSSPRRWGAVGLAVVGVLCLVAGGSRLIRRR